MIAAAAAYPSPLARLPSAGLVVRHVVVVAIYRSMLKQRGGLLRLKGG